MLIHFAVKIQMRWSVPLSSGCMVHTLSQALYLTTFLYFAWAFPGFQRETFDFWECHLSLLLFMELENQILLSLKVRETENQMIMLLHDWWIFKKATVCLQVCHTTSNRGLPEQTPRRLRCLPANSSCQIIVQPNLSHILWKSGEWCNLYTLIAAVWYFWRYLLQLTRLCRKASPDR